MKDLEPIAKYSMDDMEAKAFKIALIWQEECMRELPGESHDRIKEGKDPRKTNLFKYCYKMARETSGIVPDRDARLYVRAQIQVLKSIKDGNIHALITPQCLVGDKAWKRWKYWKRIYEKQMSKSPTSEQLGIKTGERIVVMELERTLCLLESKGFNNMEKYSKGSDDLLRWVSTGEVSPFYVVLSPWARRLFGEEDLPVDVSLHRPSITPMVEDEFRKKFAHEYR